MLRTLGRSAVLIGAISVLIQCWYPRVPLESEEEILQERMQAYDIVVIGAGLAGLSAVLQASLDGAHKLLLVDKEPKLGGNSAKASSGINALDDEMDTTFASDTTVRSFFCSTLCEFSPYRSDTKLIRRMLITNVHAATVDSC